MADEKKSTKRKKTTVVRKKKTKAKAASELQEAVEYNKSRDYTPSSWRHVQIAIGADPDGIPGTETTAKAFTWQQTHGLEADGKVGPKTLESIGAKPYSSGALFFPNLVAAYPERTFGVDVSDYQGRPNFEHIYNAGGRFAVLKFSEGRTWKSKVAPENYPKSVEAGLISSGYHLARLVDGGRESDVQGALDNFFDMIERCDAMPVGDKVLCPHFLDLELKQVKLHADKFGTSATLAWIDRFVHGYHARAGVDCGLYLSRWTARLLGRKHGDLPSLVTWWADYSTELAKAPDRGLDCWKTWHFRQFTASAIVPGVKGKCDADYARR